MAINKFANNFATTTTSTIDSSVTTVPVASVTGLPDISVSGQFYLTIDDGTNIELVLVTAVSSLNLTVTRNADSNGAHSFASGVAVEMRSDAKQMEGMVQEVNSKQGQSITLDPDDLDDTSTTNKFTTAGDISKLAGIEDNATAGGAWVLLGSATASDSASLDFTSLIDSTYDEYTIIVVDIVPINDNVALYFRASTDNGSTYLNGSTDYEYSGALNTSDTGSLTSTSSSGRSELFLCGSIGNGTEEAGTSTVFLSGVNSSNHKFLKVMNSQVTGGSYNFFNVAGGIKTTSTVNAFKVFMASGNISSGTVYLYGIKKS